MTIRHDNETALRARVAEHALRESQRDVDALYRMIDPAIRDSRNSKYDFEPEHTIAKIREYTSLIESAELVSFEIESYADDGGDSRGNVPTAIVLSVVLYNKRETAKDYRTPWVSRSGQWYTRAIGKISPTT